MSAPQTPARAGDPADPSSPQPWHPIPDEAEVGRAIFDSPALAAGRCDGWEESALRRSLSHFDRVVVLSLPARTARRRRLRAELDRIFRAEFFEHRSFTWQRAIDGQQSPPPEWWSRRTPTKPGHGAWGCLQSHYRAVECAQATGARHVLILEDDVTWLPDAARRMADFLDHVPASWDQIYFGCQHQRKPIATPAPGVLRCVDAHRTHAYALSSKFYQTFLEHIWHAPDYMARPQSHIDHQLGLLHSRMGHEIYCPDWHIAGQAAAPSDISGEDEPERWWHPEPQLAALTFVEVPAAQDFTDTDREQILARCHFGHNLRPGTLRDTGIESAMARSAGGLKKFTDMIAREALDLGKHPGISHPNIWAAAIEWPAVISLTSTAQLDQLPAIPAATANA